MIPIAKPNFIETRAVENPLLKVPPANRGNRTGAVPLAKRGEPQGGGQFEKKARVLATLVSMSLVLCAWAQGGEPLTLQEAVALALRNNRAVQISARGVDKTRNALREARSNANFTIQSNATYTRFDRVAEARFGPQPVRIGNLENRTARITLTQVVDISGIIRTAIRAADLTLTVSELEFERTRNDTILQVVQAYQGVARAEEFVRVADEALRNAQERLRLIRAQVDDGRRRAV
jgi:outer membrane protein TolC